MKEKAWGTDAPPSCHKPKPLGKMIMGGVVREYNDAGRVGGWKSGAALSVLYPPATPQQEDTPSGGGLVSWSEAEGKTSKHSL